MGETIDAAAEEKCFLLDVMLGKLAVYLRVCGYDTVYALDREIEADEEIAALADREARLLLTRDIELADRVDTALCLRSRDVTEQLAELTDAGIDLEIAPEPTRCGRCNGKLLAISPKTETPEYAPDSTEIDCWRCRSCGQLFWKGSHYDRMKETLENVR